LLLGEDEGGKNTKASDVFSLGLVFYYVLTDGKHILGSKVGEQRMSLYELARVIKRGSPGQEQNQTGLLTAELMALSRTDTEAADLVGPMLATHPADRPTATSVLSHPFFWTEQERFDFLWACGRQLERATAEEVAVLQRHCRTSGVISAWANGEWRVHPQLMTRMRLRRDYDQTKVHELLRLIRNTEEHIKTLPVAVKRALGLAADCSTAADYFLGDFRRRSPRLVLSVWRAAQELATREGAAAAAWEATCNHNAADNA